MLDVQIESAGFVLVPTRSGTTQFTCGVGVGAGVGVGVGVGFGVGLGVGFGVGRGVGVGVGLGGRTVGPTATVVGFGAGVAPGVGGGLDGWLDAEVAGSLEAGRGEPWLAVGSGDDDSPMAAWGALADGASVTPATASSRGRWPRAATAVARITTPIRAKMAAGDVRRPGRVRRVATACASGRGPSPIAGWDGGCATSAAAGELGVGLAWGFAVSLAPP